MSAQDYPARAIRFIVPFPPGGGNDTLARMIGRRLATAVGQPVVIDNRPGAAGTVGAEAAARAPADGYTLFLAGIATHGINPNLRADLPYDPIADFDAVTLIASAPLLMVVHPSLPVQSVSDLVALAKARPGQINYASNGAGTSSHLAMEMFCLATGMRMLHVPYKGMSPALAGLLAGEAQIMFSSAVAMLPQVKAGKLRVIAMTGASRAPAIPEIPTVAEAGVPGYQTASWYGVAVPAGTPRDVIYRLNREIVAIIRTPEISDRLEAEAVIPVGSTPEGFTAHIRAELARWTMVINQAGIARQ